MYGPSSSLSGTVDATFYFIVAISLFFLVLITGLMIYFAVRYRRSRHPHAVQISGNTLLEIIWTVIPVGLVLAMFHYGFSGFQALRAAPADAMVVQVTGRMWDWGFRYENGKETTRLYVPVGKAVRLVMTSLDVIHSFYIPAFRIKEDLVPGRETYLWFKPQSTGPTDIFCAEYCGQQHSYMMSEVIVMEPGDFTTWYETAEDEAAGRSAVALLDQRGCLDCHSLDGSADVGPTFQKIFGRTQTVLRGSEEVPVIVDEAYLRRAIRDPLAETAPGFETNMPPNELTEDELEAIVAYLRTMD